jgi:phosphohistidine phosphatase
MHEVGEFLAGRKVEVDFVLTSPLPRAAQTADIAAEHLKVICREEKLLAPGFSAGEVPRLLRKHPHDSLMLVGHEPDFSGIIESLTGANVKMAKAGLALVDYAAGKGRLLWLLPPRLTRK